MKTNIALLFSGVSTILIVLLLVAFFNNKQQNTTVNKPEKRSYHQDIYIHQHLYEAVQNDNTAIVLPGTENAMYPSIKNLVDSSHKKPVLVCRFSSLACQICIDHMITIMEEHFKDYDTNPQIRFVASDYNPQMRLPVNNAMNIQKERLGLPAESSSLPFLFVLIDGEANHLFIPDKEFPEYTETYLKEIKKRYLNPLI